MKKKFLIIFLLTILIFVGIRIFSLYNSGNDFLISELTDEDIAVGDDRVQAFMSSFKTSGTRSGITSMKYDDEDRDKTTYSAEKTSGIKTVSATLAVDCTLVLNIESAIEAGNAEIAVIMDGEIIERFAADTQKRLEYNVVDEHEFYVRILCESAKISITTTREFR